MLEFLAGSLIYYVFSRLWRWYRSSLLIGSIRSMEASQKAAIAANKDLMDRIQVALRQMQEARAVEKGIIQSALDREARAKAGMVAVLRRFHVPEEEIEDILARIDLEIED